MTVHTRTSVFSIVSGAGRAALLGTVFSAGLIGAASAVDITVWSGYPEMTPFYEHVAEGMKAEHPDLKVTVEAIALREHEKRIALGLTSGEAANVIELGYSTATRYLENDLFPKAPDDIAAFVSDPANYSETFKNSASYNGVVHGVPLFRGQSAIYYNTDMFKAAGLEAPPKDMAEMTAYAEKLTQRDANGNPTVSGWSMRLSGGGQGIAEKFWINMFQYGGNLVEQKADGKWRSNIANEAGLATLRQYIENVHGVKTVTIEMPADAEAFERGQTAMFIRESWVIGDIAAKAPDLKYATSTLPRGSITAPVSLWITGEGPEAEAAWAFAKAANSPENLVWLLDNVGWLPNRSGLDYTAILEKKPALGAFVNYPADYAFFSLPAIGPVEEILTRTADRLTQAFANPALLGDDKAIMEVLTATQDEINALLDREGLLAAE
ncbi:MAG TPA: extracellular solute-binding protein [Devosia sp.]|nr:extracellular solute-binding protein [Devosia sp.]